jgi:hypothetical protein
MLSQDVEKSNAYILVVQLERYGNWVVFLKEKQLEYEVFCK